MAFGQSSFIARHLLGDGLAPYVHDVRVETALYGSTTGPFGGIGGAAMTTFTMTRLLMLAPVEFVNRLALGYDQDPEPIEVALYFADETFLGWATGKSVEILAETFPRLDTASPFLDIDPTDCPVLLPEHIIAARRCT